MERRPRSIAELRTALAFALLVLGVLTALTGFWVNAVLGQLNEETGWAFAGTTLILCLAGWFLLPDDSDPDL
jgi:hypothetical protein